MVSSPPSVSIGVIVKPVGVARHEDHRHALVALGPRRCGRRSACGSPCGRTSTTSSRRRAPTRRSRGRARVFSDGHVRAGLGLGHRDRQRAALDHAAEQLALLLLGAEAVERADHDQRHAVGGRPGSGRARTPRGTASRRGRCRPSRRTPRGSAGRTSRARPCGRATSSRVAVVLPVASSTASRQLAPRSRGSPRRRPAARREPSMLSRRCAARSRRRAAGSRGLKRFSSRSAITILWTSSGPSAIRSSGPGATCAASGVSSDMPSAPCTCIARSSTSWCICAAITLIIEMSWRAARLPSVSIFQAACSTISRACVDLHARLGDEVLDELLLGQRPAERLAVVRAPAHQLERALGRRRSRACSGGCGPGPSRSWAIAKPAPRSPSRLSAGTRQSS